MENLLPKNGVVNLFENAFTFETATNYFKILKFEVDWRADEIQVYGKRYVMNRKAAWYGDREFQYKYSGRVKTALGWTPLLLEIKNRVQQITGFTYNSCLLNYYNDGSDGMSWHSDNEKSMLPNGAIASVSFGANRIFHFKHKSEEIKKSFMLSSGSILLMHGEVQQYWLHALPKTKKVSQPRINLTFRTFID